MKQLFIYLFAFIGCLNFIACDPINDREELGGNISADQIEATVRLEEVNGKKVNKAILDCSSPILCRWSNGVLDKSGNHMELLMFGKGEQIITLTGLCQDGTYITKEFTVNVEDLYYEIDPTYNLLFGNGEKKWKWAEGVCLGNGGWRPDQQAPEWWTLTKADVEGQQASEGNDATMTFSLYGKKVTFSNGKTGNIDFSTGGACFDSWYGTFSSTCGVLCGKAFNDCYIGQGNTIVNYQLVSVTEDKLVLAFCEDASMGEWSGTGWWWVFEAVK